MGTQPSLHCRASRSLCCLHIWRSVCGKPHRVLVPCTLHWFLHGIHKVLLLGEEHLLHPHGGPDPRGQGPSPGGGTHLLSVGAHHPPLHGLPLQVARSHLENVQRSVRNQH